MLDALGLTIISLRANGRSRDGLLAVAFFVIVPRRLQRLFPAEISTVHLLLYQVRVRVLLLDVWDYTQEGKESQESRISIYGDSQRKLLKFYLGRKVTFSANSL